MWAPGLVQARCHSMSPGDFENVFIKAGDREMKGRLRWKKQQERAQADCFGSLGMS